MFEVDRDCGLIFLTEIPCDVAIQNGRLPHPGVAQYEDLDLLCLLLPFVDLDRTRPCLVYLRTFGPAS